MKFRPIHTDPQQYYAVGVDDDTGKLVLEVVITWVGWYIRFFAISQEEFAWFSSSKTLLDELATSCAGVAGIANNHERFLSSQKADESPVLLNRHA